MKGSTIGIKLADGKFYPILEKDPGEKKKLILTTAGNRQTNVKIDLFESETNTISDSRFIGSLELEDLEPMAKGETDIELFVAIEPDGNLRAQALDRFSGSSQSLNINMDSVSGVTDFAIPDFDFEAEDTPWTVSDENENENENEENTTSEKAPSYFHDELAPDFQQLTMEEPKREPLRLILFIVFAIFLIAVLVIFINKLVSEPNLIPPLEAGSKTSDDGALTVADVDIELPSGTPLVEDANLKPRVAEPDPPKVESVGVRDGPVVSSTPSVANSVAGNARIGGVWYWIRRGDTLWDLSSSFYRNPYRYGTIAEKNSIANPDLIYAGTKIFIPDN